MSGVTLVKTPGTVGAAVSGWTGLFQTSLSYANGTATQEQLVAAGESFLTAAVALTSSNVYAGAFSNLTGMAGALVNLRGDIDAYKKADNQLARDQAVASLVNDAASVGGGVATGLVAAGNALEEEGLIAFGEAIAEGSGVITAITAAVGVGITTLKDFQDYLQKLEDKLEDPAVEQNLWMQLNMNDPDGNAEIIMPGQQGDALVAGSLGGSASEYSETGTDISSVQLAQNGASDVQTINGDEVVDDTSGSQISLSTAVNATIEGSNNTFIVSGGVSSARISGSGNDIQVDSTASGSTLTLNGAGAIGDSIKLVGTTDVTVTVSDSTTAINLAGGTNGNITIGSSAGATTQVTVNGVSGDNVTLAGSNLTFNASSGQYNLTGTNNTITLSSGSAATVSATSNDHIRDGATGQVVSFGLSTAVLAIGGEQLFGSNGMDWGYAGESNTFTVNADGSMTVKAVADASDYSLYSVNASGQLTEAQAFYNGAIYTTETFAYSNGTPTESRIYNGNGVLAEINQLDSSGNWVSGQAYDTSGEMTAQAWQSSTYDINYEYSAGAISSIDLYSLVGNGIELRTYDSLDRELEDTTALRDGSSSGWTYLAGSPFASLEQTNVSIGTSGQSAVSAKISFNDSNGLVTQATLYGGFNSAGVASTEEVLTSNGGKYFSEIDTYDPATGQLTGSATYDSETGDVTAQSGSTTPGPAVLTSTYLDQAAANFDASAYGIPNPTDAAAAAPGQVAQIGTQAKLSANNVGSVATSEMHMAAASSLPEGASPDGFGQLGSVVDSWLDKTYSQLGQSMVTWDTHGKLVPDSQIGQIIQAMATFSAGHTNAGIEMPVHTAITDPDLIAVSNNAWHR